MARRLALLALLVLPVGWAAQAQAHEVRPAFLQLEEIDDGRWRLDWRVPARGEARLRLDVVLPEDCVEVGAPTAAFVSGMHVQRREVRCGSDLAGREIRIDGLKRTMVDAIVRVVPADGPEQTARLVPSLPAFTVTGATGDGGVAGTYFVLGVEHILLGIDHLLFVLALILIVEGWARLVKTITAFTVAHSLTLAAATLGWVWVPIPPVEAVIALSIVFLAAEIVHARRGRPGLAQRRTWLVAFVFGLLHGLGFASALSEVGLPSGATPAALFFFNVGVEAGQLLFVGAVLPLLALARRTPALEGARWTWQLPVYAIGSIAACWVIQRIAGFWA